MSNRMPESPASSTRRVIKQVTLALFINLVVSSAVLAVDKVEKASLASGGKKHSYYLFVPASVQSTVPAPLLVLLHGSNRNGLSLIEKWKDLATAEGIIVVGPDSLDSSRWLVPEDGPVFIHDLVEALKAKHPIDPRRVYLFGHSGGAVFALMISMYESEYFAATAIHAGALDDQQSALSSIARRKIPISIQVGANDLLFPLKWVRATRELLIGQGFSVQLTEIPNHDHWYYDLAPTINLAAWEFLKRQRLEDPPRFAEYEFRPKGVKSNEAGEQYNRGLERQRSGDLTGAITAYSRALELDPKFADAYTNRGVARMAQQDAAGAAADFSRSIELKPTAAAFNNRGGAYHALKKQKEAIADFTKAIELQPSAESYFNRAIIETEDGSADLAVQDLTSALALNPKLAQAYASRGMIFLRQEKYAEAQRDFNEALKLDGSLRSQLEPALEQLRKKHQP